MKTKLKNRNMGMGAELLSEMEATYWAEEHNRQSIANCIIENYKMGICFWNQKNGEKILVQDMDDKHLINTANLILRNSKNESELHSITNYAWKQVFNAEKTKRKIN